MATDPLDKKTVKSHTTDGTTVVYDGASDTIALDKHKRAVKASQNPFAGITRMKMVPPNGMGVNRGTN